MTTFLLRRIALIVPTLFFRVIVDLRVAAAVARRSGDGAGGRGPRSLGHRVSAREISPRSALAGALCTVDRGRRTGGSRRVDPHQAAGPRSDRREIAGHRRIGVDGITDRASDRGAGRHPCRGQERYADRLHRVDGGAVGPVDPEFLARHPAYPVFLGRARPVAGFRFRQPGRKPEAEPADPDHAGLRARQRDRRGHDAPHPQRDAAGVERRFRTYRARQGTARDPRHPTPCPTQRADPGRDIGRPRIRPAAVGRGVDRAGVHDSRLRQADRRCRVQPRLCGRAGRRAVHRLRLHPLKPVRRHRLCRAEPAAADMTAQTLEALPVEEPIGEAPWRRALRQLIKRRAAMIGLAVVVFFILLAAAAPFVSPYDPLATNWATVRKAPSAAHLFGTDEIGRDVLARIIWGSRASLLAGLVSVMLALAVGVPIGLVSGYAGGALDATVMRIIDAMLAIPFLILAIALAAFLGPSLTNAMIAIGITQMPIFARLTRGQELSVKHEDYVEAARAVGNPQYRIVLRHIFPNIVPPLLVQATLATAAAIIAEASLSFLGLGQQPPNPSWGSMLNTAKNFLQQAPWMAIWPGLAISGLVLSLNLFGDGLRDALDPRGDS